MRAIGRGMLLMSTMLGLGYGGALEGIAAAQAPDTTQAAATDPTNLSQYVAADFCAAIVIHPAKILRSPAFSALPESPEAAIMRAAEANPEGKKALELLPPGKIYRVVSLVDPTPAGNQPVSGLAILQVLDPIDQQKLTAMLVKDAQPGEFQGVKYVVDKQGRNGAPPMAVYVAGPRTVLLGSEASLKKALSSAGAPGPLLEQLRRNGSLKDDIVIEYAAEPFLKSPAGEMVKSMAGQAGQGGQAGPGMTMGSIEDVKSATLAINLGSDPMVKLILVASKAEAADKFHGALMAAKFAAQMGLDGLKKDPPPMLPADLKDPLSIAAQELVQGFQVNRQGDQVVATLPTPSNLPELIGKVAEAAKNLPPGMLSVPGAPGGPAGPGFPGQPAPDAPAQEGNP